MFGFAVSLLLDVVPPATKDDVVDLVASLVDALDEAGVEPDVSTAGVGGQVTVRVSFPVEAAFEADAHRAGQKILFDALEEIGLLTSHLHDIESRTALLAAAS